MRNAWYTCRGGPLSVCVCDVDRFRPLRKNPFLHRKLKVGEFFPLVCGVPSILVFDVFIENRRSGNRPTTTTPFKLKCVCVCVGWDDETIIDFEVHIRIN